MPSPQGNLPSSPSLEVSSKEDQIGNNEQSDDSEGNGANNSTQGVEDMEIRQSIMMNKVVVS